jgi:hypothetical protein
VETDTISVAFPALARLGGLGVVTPVVDSPGLRHFSTLTGRQRAARRKAAVRLQDVSRQGAEAPQRCPIVFRCRKTHHQAKLLAQFRDCRP